MNLPFSSLIYGVLQQQGFEKYAFEDLVKLERPYKIDRRLINPPHFNDLTDSCSTPASPSALAPPPSIFEPTPAPIPEDADLHTKDLLKKNIAEMDTIIAALICRRMQDKLLLQEVESRISAQNVAQASSTNL